MMMMMMMRVKQFFVARHCADTAPTLRPAALLRCIRVYQRDGVTGTVELLNPRDDYDLVFTNDNDENGGGDDNNNGGGEGGEAMIDEGYEGGSNDDKSMGEGNSSSDGGDDDEDTLYIVTADPQASLSSSRILQETDTVT